MAERMVLVTSATWVQLCIELKSDPGIDIVVWQKGKVAIRVDNIKTILRMVIKSRLKLLTFGIDWVYIWLR